MSANTIAETEAAVSSLPGSTVLTEPFAEGNHNYQNEDAAVNAQLDADLRSATTEFVSAALR